MIASSGCIAAPVAQTQPSPTIEIALPSPVPASETPPISACNAIFNPIGFAADGGHLIGVLTVDGRLGSWLQILDLNSLTMQTVLAVDPFVNATALSPDRQTVAWAWPDFRAQMIDLDDGNVISTFIGHKDVINALVFSPDGTRLYSGSRDASVIAWDMSGKILDTFQPTGVDNFPMEVLGLGISPDGETLITIPFEGNAKAWDMHNNRELREYQGAILGAYNGASSMFSPDGQLLVIGLAAGPGSASMWRISDSTKLWSGGFFADFDFSPDNRFFAHRQPTDDNKAQVIISSPDGQTVYQALAPQDTIIGDLLFSPDSTKLVVASWNRIEVWNVDDGALLKSYKPACP